MDSSTSNSVLSVLGVGWVTALGRDPQSVWQRVLAGERPETSFLPGIFGAADAPVYAVPLPTEDAAGFARLRRSSAISYFANAAAMAAMAQAALEPCERMALVMASSNGAVIYTRKFYADMLDRGTGSPLLFPETVYNAPTSHVAARLGIDGAALTFVGDSSAGADALLAAAEMISSGEADRCLIVAAEEADWLVWESSRRWGLDTPVGGMTISEGAVALVVGPPGGNVPQIEAVHQGLSYSRSCSLQAGLGRILQDLSAIGPMDLVMLSASGSRMDRGEAAAVERELSGIPCIAPKKCLGEAFSASTLAQAVCAVVAIQEGRASRAIAPVVGWSGQLGGFVVCRGVS